MNVLGIIFIAVSSLYLPYGFNVTKFETKEECYNYYESLQGFRLVEEHINFYNSDDEIKVYTTPMGTVVLTCKELN